MASIQNKIAWGAVAALSLLVVAALAGVAQGGPLDPPGPPASTQRTQITSLPFTINTPVSYVVMGDLTGVAGSNGISINVSDVTLDLNGFTLRGVPGSLIGVSAGSHSNISVFNGTVRNWGTVGVDLPGQCHIVRDLHANANGTFGIIADVASEVSNCMAHGNSGDGINVGIGSTITNCAARANTGDGIRVLTPGITITASVAAQNNGDGIQVADDTLVFDNTSYANGQGGFDGAAIHVTGSDNRIEDNNVTDSDRGIDIDVGGNLIIKNSASGNTTNYDIVAGNTVGPILGVADPIASTNPWANFAY